ncbi:lysophospholipid acyltransferase family protein [Acidovorax sp. M2(2025)]|uniref:lysophospholipid acyltransferase family protein n=1 Tax=Acidovorax sp. M2(2025) TaxID=3411355 RepID=UPI003BF4C4F0
MSHDWRMQWGYPGLAGLPGTLPWKLAPYLGRDPGEARRATEDFLCMRFGQVFPESTPTQRAEWARAHMDMVALEMMDGIALHRLGGVNGPAIELAGWEHVQALAERKTGFIVVLSHFDRLMTSLVALARQGLVMNALTMPVLDNPDLSPVHRRFLTRKVNNLVSVIHGQYRSTSESLRPVHEGLLAGDVWIILADVWQPHFGRLRKHPFLGGEISLPTGIERLAKSTGVPLVHAITYSQGASRLKVEVDPLPEDPKEAVDAVIQRLEKDVRARPWAWWQWGVWDHMWRRAGQTDGEERL